ncbi:hypothetical protein Rhopal_006778-T1 [Rhodotorula paludigena]|uniref:D-arabinono-1,4-lactone oxidase n=1 Tax=Rhodotorula paludigena TaxID=86838 RepID=A0AAV5GMA5_9BASI|nr:hypothetical protein Rhopal_006778-T1 [Rhodotorula paludigena]
MSTAELRRSLAPCTILAGSALTFTNWATTFRSQTSAVFRPTTVEQVRWAVELARREGRELRAAGAGHSPSDIVCTGGYLLDLKGLNKVLDVDADAKTFHAEGGILIRDLHPVLLERGSLAVSSLGSISDQTLAGAISTSTHGSGVSFPSLSTCVTFLDLVLPLPGAPVVRVSQDADPDHFHAALCGLGVVGIVVGVGMRVERAFKLEEECFSMRFDDFTARWQEIAESAEHVRCWWFPQVGRVKVSRLNRTLKPITPRPSALSLYFTEIFLAKHVHALILFGTRYFPSLLPYHSWFMWTVVHQPGPIRWGVFLRGMWTRLTGRVGKDDPWPRVQDLAYGALEAEEAVEAVQAVEKAAPAPLAASDPLSLSPPSPPPSLSVSPAPLDLAELEQAEKLSLSRPTDILTPPDTPPAFAASSSPSRVARVPSPLASSIESLPEPEVPIDAKEKDETVPLAPPRAKRLPWPILEDEPTYRVDLGVNIFNYDCGFPQYTYESCVPYASTGAALDKLHEWHTHALAEPGYPLRAHFPIEIRWTEQDDGWLSPTRRGRGCYLGAIQYRPFNLPVPYRAYFSNFSTLLHTLFSGAPHWAKSHALTPADLRALYPQFDAFLAVRERVDPEKVLVNAYVRRHLLGEVEKERMEVEGRRYKVRP